MQETERHRFNPWVRKIPWGRKWQPTPVFLHGKLHAQRSLADCSSLGRKESDETEWLRRQGPVMCRQETGSQGDWQNSVTAKSCWALRVHYVPCCLPNTFRTLMSMPLYCVGVGGGLGIGTIIPTEKEMRSFSFRVTCPRSYSL